MLVMRRRTGEAVLIGSDIEIHILSIHRSKVKIGINAPRSIPVCAREVEFPAR
jgi:carbon storage regulator